MESKSSQEIKLLSLTNQLQDEIIGHQSSILYRIQNAVGNVKSMLTEFGVSDEKKDKDEFLVKIPKSKYNELLQFMNRLSSNENYENIDTRIAEEKSDIRYKNDLIKKLK